MEQALFLSRLDALPVGYSEGHYRGRRYGITVSASAGGERRRLYAEELGGTDRVSFNLYVLSSGAPVLKPCEMPARKVIDFVLRVRQARTAAGHLESLKTCSLT